MVLLVPDMFTRTTPVLRRSSSLKGWSTDHSIQQQQSSSASQQHPIKIKIKRMPSPSPTRIYTNKQTNIHHVHSMPKLTSPHIKHVTIPTQSPPSHPPFRTTPHPIQSSPIQHDTTAHRHPHPRPTLRPSRNSPSISHSSSMPILSPVPTPTRPPLSPVSMPTRPPLLRHHSPTRTSLLRRTSSHMDDSTFERVTRRRLLSPTPTSSTTTTSTTAPPPPSPTSPRRRRLPRRFTFTPIHVLTSQMRDTNVHEYQYEYEQENTSPIIHTWGDDRKTSPVWQPPPALHTLIEDEWEERQPFTIAPSTQTSTISSTSSHTPLRPPPILLPHTIASAPPYRYNPITPTTTDHNLQSPPLFHHDDVQNTILSPSFANLSMDVDMMIQLPHGWHEQDMGRITPSPTTNTNTTTTTTTSTSTLTPRVIDDITQEIGQWIHMDIQ